MATLTPQIPSGPSPDYEIINLPVSTTTTSSPPSSSMTPNQEASGPVPNVASLSLDPSEPALDTSPAPLSSSKPTEPDPSTSPYPTTPTPPTNPLRTPPRARADPTLDCQDARRSYPPSSTLSHLLTTYTHAHTLLLSLPTQQTSTLVLQDEGFEVPVQVTDPVTPGSGSACLHHWDGRDVDVSWCCELDGGSGGLIEGLGYVLGFRELSGIGGAGVKVRIGEGEDVHEALSTRVSDAASEEELITNLIQKLREEENEEGAEEGESVTLQFYKFTVFSKEEGSPFYGKEEAIWGWVKEGSAYSRKHGSWEESIEKAFKDGEWSAGRGLKVCVNGVSRPHKEELFKSGSRGWMGMLPEREGS